MEVEDPTLLADRVDAEPPIFRGCSSSELLAMMVISITSWLPLSIIAALIVNRPAYFLGILAVGVLGTMYFGAGVFYRIKRNRPDHYYVHYVKKFMHTRKLRTAQFTWRSGIWDVDRTGAEVNSRISSWQDI
jgi:conjugative transfer region protein (TIGR03750 family)